MINLQNKDAILFMKELKENSIDLIIADPDYNIGLELSEGQIHYGLEGEKTFHGAKRGGKILKKDELKNFFYNFFIESKRILKKGGNIFIYFSTQEIYILQGILEELGFLYQNTIIWDKTTVQGEYNKKLKFMYEPILHYSNGETKINIDKIRVPRNPNDKRKYKTDGQNPGNIWRGQSPRGKNKLTNHPTEKPTFLSKRFMNMTVNKGDTCYIPFLGSGLDIDVGLDLGLNMLGTEINEKYFTIISDRINRKYKNI